MAKPERQPARKGEAWRSILKRSSSDGEHDYPSIKRYGDWRIRLEKMARESNR
jgi:hypothetical protein